MKYFKISIVVLLLLIFSSILSGAEKQKDIRYKVSISNFNAKKIPTSINYFKSSLPRSIRTVLRKNHEVIYSSKNINLEKLKDNNFDLQIKGWLIKRKNDFIVEFFVINVKTNSLLILADITGDADRRIFDLVDTMVKNLNRILKKPISELQKNPEIISIDRKGKISLKKLAGADLDNRNLIGVNLSKLNMSGASFKNANLSKSKFINADLTNANFSGANLSGADLSGAKLKGAIFTKANLTDTTIKKTDLSNINFSGVNLEKANLTDSDLSFTSFNKAELSRTNLNNTVLYKTNFTGAKGLGNVGDINIGLQGMFGAYGWFTVEGRIYKNFFVGMKIGYAQDTENSELKNLPIFITATYYLFDYSTFSKPVFRPYISIGMGYRIGLSEESSDGFISALYIGAELFLATRLSIYADGGAFYNGSTFYPTVGAGLRIHLPNIASTQKLIVSNTRKVSEKVKQKTKKSKTEDFKFLAVKVGIGMSYLLQSTEEEISDNMKFGFKLISYSIGARFFYLWKNSYGIIADIEYLDIGGAQRNDETNGTHGVTHIHYVSFNVLFGLKFFENFYFGIGVYLGIPVGAQVKYTEPYESEADIYEMYKRLDFGGMFTITYMFHFKGFSLFFGMDFKMSILSVYRELDTMLVPEDYAVRNIAILINIGFGM